MIINIHFGFPIQKIGSRKTVRIYNRTNLKFKVRLKSWLSISKLDVYTLYLRILHVLLLDQEVFIDIWLKISYFLIIKFYKSICLRITNEFGRANVICSYDGIALILSVWTIIIVLPKWFMILHYFFFLYSLITSELSSCINTTVVRLELLYWDKTLTLNTMSSCRNNNSFLYVFRIRKTESNVMYICALTNAP